MLTEQRFDIILKLLEERKSITVTELRELLDASESTVRRDITALDKAGKLTKVFGGAVALNHKVTAYEPTVAQKSELNKEECLKSIKYSSLLPFNPQGTMGLHNQFMKDLSEGLYNGYNLDGGLVNNTLLNPLLNKNLDKIIVISMKHDYTLPDEIKNICNEDNIIIVRPKTVFDKNDTLRFEKEFCKQIYYEGYEIGKKLNKTLKKKLY